jgi:hypothetical protein
MVLELSLALFTIYNNPATLPLNVLQGTCGSTQPCTPHDVTISQSKRNNQNKALYSESPNTVIEQVTDGNEFQLKSALRGVNTLFLQVDLTEDNQPFYDTLIVLAKAIKVQFVVLLSYFHQYSNSNFAKRFSQMETMIKSKNLPYCIIRTGFSFQHILRANPNAFSSRDIRFLLTESSRTVFIDELDLIQCICAVIQNPDGFANQGNSNSYFSTRIPEMSNKSLIFINTIFRN